MQPFFPQHTCYQASVGEHLPLSLERSYTFAACTNRQQPHTVGKNKMYNRQMFHFSLLWLVLMFAITYLLNNQNEPRWYRETYASFKFCWGRQV